MKWVILRPEQLFKKWLDISILCNFWDEKRLMNLSRAIHWSQTSYFWTVYCQLHWQMDIRHWIWNYFNLSQPNLIDVPDLPTLVNGFETMLLCTYRQLGRHMDIIQFLWFSHAFFKIELLEIGYINCIPWLIAKNWVN